MVDESTFREDLYYRLDVVRLQAASAARAPEVDIPLLVQHFLEPYAECR